MLIIKGFRQDIIKECDNFAIKLQISDRVNYCLGRAGCFRPSAFLISCPHIACFMIFYFFLM